MNYNSIYGVTEEKAVAAFAKMLALDYGISPDIADKIHNSAMLHDVGKLQLPARILNKPTTLTESEFEIVKTHTTLGAEMLKSMGSDEMTCLIAEFHHECWDGSGYWHIPLQELPDFVAITAIADVYVSLISKRTYKEAWTSSEALAYIKSRSGIQFNPKLVEVFVPIAENDNRVSSVLEGTIWENMILHNVGGGVHAGGY